MFPGLCGEMSLQVVALVVHAQPDGLLSWHLTRQLSAAAPAWLGVPGIFSICWCGAQDCVGSKGGSKLVTDMVCVATCNLWQQRRHFRGACMYVGGSQADIERRVRTC
jgi:hypothetical protein